MARHAPARNGWVVWLTFAIGLLLYNRQNAYAFALLSGVVFFAWGEIFSLFPSLLTDTFGTKHATTNYGFLYMAQGVGSLLGGPFAALVHDAVGSWVPVFGIAIGFDLATAALAFLVLKPMRAAWHRADDAIALSPAGAPA